MFRIPSVHTMPAAVGVNPSAPESNVNVMPHEPQPENRECPLLPPPSTESIANPGPIMLASGFAVTPTTPADEKGPSDKRVMSTSVNEGNDLNGLSATLS